jgi:hypothetical protein
MADRDEAFRQAMGLKKLDPTWAKLEIFIGLAAVWIGLRHQQELFGGLLFVFGGYLALAGSRSHLYQSLNRVAAFLWDGSPRP